MTDPEFAPSFRHGMVIMLDGTTRRSIITTISHCERNNLTTYQNKKWIIRHSSSYDYEVTDRKTETRYFISGYWNGYEVPISWSVYKRKVGLQ